MGAGRKLALALASGLGVGYVPLAPGTLGSLVALPIWWACAELSVLAFAGVALAVSVLAVAVAGAAEQVSARHDAQYIVIDEVAGMLITGVGVPFAWPQVVAGFVLFRLLDILKPWPIGFLDRRVPGGLGVVLDDVAAGVIACLVLHATRFVLNGWW
ncbi:MAG: phosphatidylglycerophosphatase A [Deltaproteobacteria bacterium]|nr:phosphatidylglycerophosphatase A [Deltaproteobacteria bacterium]